MGLWVDRLSLYTPSPCRGTEVRPGVQRGVLGGSGPESLVHMSDRQGNPFYLRYGVRVGSTGQCTLVTTRVLTVLREDYTRKVGLVVILEDPGTVLG